MSSSTPRLFAHHLTERPSTDTGFTAASSSTAVSTKTPFEPSPLSSFATASGHDVEANKPEEELRHKFRRSMHLVKPSEVANVAIEEKAKDRRPTGLKGLIRRASVSLRIKTRPRRNTLTFADDTYDVQESRPTTSSGAWRMLRTAASFRNPKSAFEHEDPQLPKACDSVEPAIPGIGTTAPFIPRQGRGGDAARAKAALLNGQMDQAFCASLRPKHLEDPQGDRESGIGIAVNASEESSYTFQSNSEQPDKVDFVNFLPLELSIQILSKLDELSLTRAALVSRAWNRVSSSGHVWREAYCRDWSHGYAISKPLRPGDGHGLPPVIPNMPWKVIHKARRQLKDNWNAGRARHIYLTGHLDSIYCVQFDE